MKLNEISDFKKREIEYELRNEPPNNYAVIIDGKTWKVVADRRRAAKMVDTLRNRGKDARYAETGAPVSEAEEAKRNPTQTYNLRGKYKTTVTKSGDSMRPVWHASIEGHDLGKFSSEKAAMQAASNWIDTEKNSVSEAQPLAASKKPNPVKKNMDKFHKPKTHKDMKAAQKRGYEKHKAKELQEGPVVVRGEGHLHNLVDNMVDGWFEAKSRTREELEKVLNAIGKTITGDAERLVIDNIGKAEDYSIEEKKTKQRLDPKCWKGYKKQGTKMKGGVRVNNCVPK